MTEPSESAVVLLSGGQDSTTCFHWALREFERVSAVMFDYGQRHRVELDLASKTADLAGVPWTVLPIEALSRLAGGSLTNPEVENTPGGAPAESGWHAERGLPPSFVPGRNLLFFTLAAAWGIPRGHGVIVTGVCQQDRAGYPDCRAEFVDAMEGAIRVGMGSPEFAIAAPLLNRSKADTWALSAELGIMGEIIRDTHSCYEGDRSHLHAWGYGCGECGACSERSRGYLEFQSSLTRA